jgi:hypothetical protein
VNPLRTERRARIKTLLIDIAVGVLWALLLAAVLLFKSGASQFIYVDF